MEGRLFCQLRGAASAAYNKERLHGKAYFSELLGSLQEVPRSVVELLELT